MGNRDFLPFFCSCDLDLDLMTYRPICDLTRITSGYIDYVQI